MGKAKLTNEQIEEIKKLYHPTTKGGRAGQQEGSMNWLAEKFDVSVATVFKIIHRMRKPTLKPIERFMRLVKKLDNGCWLWLGALDKYGRGYFMWPEAHIKRPRSAALLLFKNQTTPKGRALAVSCKTTRCVHPDHIIPKRILFEGDEASFRRLLQVYKKSAYHRQIKFNLSEEVFRKLTKQNCVYCGSEPKSNAEAKSGRPAYLYNGIDRVDNAIGYVDSNCVTCCEICNRMKLAMSVKEFLNHAQKIAKNKP